MLNMKTISSEFNRIIIQMIYFPFVIYVCDSLQKIENTFPAFASRNSVSRSVLISAICTMFLSIRVIHMHAHIKPN